MVVAHQLTSRLSVSLQAKFNKTGPKENRKTKPGTARSSNSVRLQAGDGWRLVECQVELATEALAVARKASEPHVGASL